MKNKVIFWTITNVLLKKFKSFEIYNENNYFCMNKNK